MSGATVTHGGGIVQDMAVGRFTVKYTRSPLGDVRQVTKQHALIRLHLPASCQRRFSPDRLDEILKMI